MNSTFTAEQIRLLQGLVAKFESELTASLTRSQLTEQGRLQYLRDVGLAQTTWRVLAEIDETAT